MTRREQLRKRRETPGAEPPPRVKVPRGKPKLKAKKGKFRVGNAWYMVLIPEFKQPKLEQFKTQEEVIQRLRTLSPGTLVHIFCGTRYPLTAGGGHLVQPDNTLAPVWSQPTELEIDDTGLIGPEEPEIAPTNPADMYDEENRPLWAQPARDDDNEADLVDNFDQEEDDNPDEEEDDDEDSETADEEDAG